ncbi:hypothetical protein P5V15_015037 [Pogonomyrmex californicus]
MKAKTKLGMGLRKKKRKTRMIFPTAKRGGLLPIFPILGALGSLIDGAAGVAKVVNAGKAARCQLEELQCHNRAMEDHGLHVAFYKRGSGVTRRTKKKKSWKETLRSLELPASRRTSSRAAWRVVCEYPSSEKCLCVTRYRQKRDATRAAS